MLIHRIAIGRKSSGIDTLRTHSFACQSVHLILTLIYEICVKLKIHWQSGMTILRTCSACLEPASVVDPLIFEVVSNSPINVVLLLRSFRIFFS